MQANLDMRAIEALRGDLVADGLDFVRLDLDGELIIREGKKVERWQLREEGEGRDNTYWAPEYYPGGFEFCGSLKG